MLKKKQMMGNVKSGIFCSVEIKEPLWTHCFNYFISGFLNFVQGYECCIYHCEFVCGRNDRSSIPQGIMADSKEWIALRFFCSQG